MTGETPEFDTEDRKRVYEFVREHEPVEPGDIRDADVLPVTPSRYWQIVAILKRDGYVRGEEGLLRDAYEPRGREEHAGERDDVSFTVRAADLDDLTGLAGVIRQVLAGETYLVGQSFSDQLADIDTLVHGAADAPPTYFVAVHDGEVVGWVNLDAPGSDRLSHAVELTMGLLDEFRGYGIGSALLDRAVSWAGAHGYRKVFSNVPASNKAAVEFLEGNGWEVEATRPNHYVIDDALVDEVLVARWT
jgi:ribosomal protein S18 acetylase RimI-like enzyme